MLDLVARKWVDMHGKVWKLEDINDPHLINIQKMLSEIITGKREIPYDCNQTMDEIKQSNQIICDEISRRNKLLTVSVGTMTTYTITIKNEVKVSDFITCLQGLPKSAIIVSIQEGKITFKVPQK